MQPVLRALWLLAAALTASACGGELTGHGNLPADDSPAGAPWPGQRSPSPSGHNNPSGMPPSPPPSPTRRPHQRCGWIVAGDDAGERSFIQNAGWFDAVHPAWYELTADGGNVIAVPNSGVDNPQVLRAARNANVLVIPMIHFATLGGLRAMMADPRLRATHIGQLVRIAVDHGYDGLDLDYERLFERGDRALLSTLIVEAAEALHAAGKQLSLAMPALGLPDPGGNAYDYNLISRTVDTAHLMGYDFHWLRSHEGPLAPVGWIRGAMDHVVATGRPEVFRLGLANYSISPSATYRAAEVVRRCADTGGYSVDTDHMASCPFGAFEAGLAPHCRIAGAVHYFEDRASLEQKIALARQAGLGGIAYWAAGDEVDGLFEVVRRYYP